MRYFFFFSHTFYRFLLLSFARFIRKFIRQFISSQQLPSRLGHLAWRPDLTLQEPRRIFISNNVSIGKGVILSAPDGLAKEDTAKLVIADNVFLGTEVELGLAAGCTLSIGRNTSMHRGTVILGNVKIGCNCIFSYNIFIASGTHVINAKPTWLIKDQDEHFLSEQPSESVIIEDDVWLGWGVFVKSGVSIGRGAIVGANSVVTRDIEPYSICAGAPARITGRRLDFKPPRSVHADCDEDLPYFYAGFKDDQTSLAISRNEGTIWAEQQSRIMLQNNNARSLHISGRLKELNTTNLPVRIYINQQLLTEFEVIEGTFEKFIDLKDVKIPAITTPQYFSSYIELSIHYSGVPSFSLGISEAKLQD